ncbi:MAG: retropepsin-like domain-containing protein [Euryarchaeota archaeon]|nr:retropepsin-like domain-containing protein [Euryarchaeota archaeon]MDE2046418.1 retropepsin-like domain-containing protein [Thermoplasmata archaeon]
MVHVRLTWKSKQSLQNLLMDSGATFTLLPPWIAEDLGLELGAPLQEPARGVGGSVVIRPSRVCLQVVGPDTLGFPGRVWVMDPIMVAAADEEVPTPLLGRRPFLMHHELIVREDRRELVLREL